MNRPPRLLESKTMELGSWDSVASFETSGGGYWPVWDRYIAVDGKRVVHIGNVCDTCCFFFQRLGSNDRPPDSGVADATALGLISLADPVVEAWGSIIPSATYVVCLLEVYPTLVTPGAPADYFAREQVALWGPSGEYGALHDPRTQYFRIGESAVERYAMLFQFLIPLQSLAVVDNEAIARHVAAIEQGRKPTVAALSVLDVKQPADWQGEPAVTKHWCLAHYMLDGHHKAIAAAMLNRPITLLSFIALDHGVSVRGDIERAVQALAQG